MLRQLRQINLLKLLHQELVLKLRDIFTPRSNQKRVVRLRLPTPFPTSSNSRRFTVSSPRHRHNLQDSRLRWRGKWLFSNTTVEQVWVKYVL